MNRHISAFALVVPDYDECIDFYVNKVGFNLLEDTDMGGGKRWVRISPSSGAETSILVAKAVNAEQLSSVGNQAGGRVGFFLHTDDFDTDYARMSKQGVSFEEAPRTEPYGKVAVWVDPWGNRWDLLQLS